MLQWELLNSVDYKFAPVKGLDGGTTQITIREYSDCFKNLINCFVGPVWFLFLEYVTSQ